MKLENRVAIVTGAGRGIGRAIALAFAREGAHLVLASRTLAEVEATAGEIGALGLQGHPTKSQISWGPRQALALKADVAQRAEVEAMVAATVERFGRIDILVNNAAVQPPIGPLWENDPDEWLRTVLVNLGGVFLCCRTVVPAMIRQGGGKIINLSGGGATSPRPYFTAYAASKAAVVRLTESLAQEVQPFHIQVNAIAPGPVSTRMTEEILAAAGAAGQGALAEARQVSQEARTPEAAVELALFLASDESGDLTGRLISALWDDWRGAKERMREIMASDAWTLRRVPLATETSPLLRHRSLDEGFGSAIEDGYDILTTPRVRKILAIASQMRAREILDTGCGDGTLTAKLKEVLGADVARGVDIYPEAVKLARDKGIEALQVDLNNEDLPFPADSFDFAFCGEVIEHLFDPGSFLSDVRRVLKPGGQVIVTTPNLASWYNRLALLMGFQPWSTAASWEDTTAGKFLGKTWATAGGGHLRVITLRALHDLLRLRGFTHIKFHGAASIHTLGAMSLPLRLPVSLLQTTLGRIPSLATTLIAEAVCQK